MLAPDALAELRKRLLAWRGPGAFNQFAEVNLDYDRPDGAVRRLANLLIYLDHFEDAAYVLVGEAPGYNGGRFSGVWFTDERFLVGERALPWARALAFQRSSRDDLPLRREMSSTIVWSALGDRRDIVFWPAFPAHPMGLRGAMSNRAPRRDELVAGREFLRFFLHVLFPGRIVVAIGRHGEAAATALGHTEIRYIRHPAQGGATAFRQGIAALPRRDE